MWGWNEEKIHEINAEKRESKLSRLLCNRMRERRLGRLAAERWIQSREFRGISWWLRFKSKKTFFFEKQRIEKEKKIDRKHNTRRKNLFFLFLDLVGAKSKTQCFCVCRVSSSSFFFFCIINAKWPQWQSFHFWACTKLLQIACQLWLVGSIITCHFNSGSAYILISPTF